MRRFRKGIATRTPRHRSACPAGGGLPHPRSDILEAGFGPSLFTALATRHGRQVQALARTLDHSLQFDVFGRLTGGGESTFRIPPSSDGGCASGTTAVSGSARAPSEMTFTFDTTRHLACLTVLSFNAKPIIGNRVDIGVGSASSVPSQWGTTASLGQTRSSSVT